MSQVVITKERTIHTYAELWQGAGFCLQMGQMQEQGRQWFFLSSALLTAFSFEAYLNHVGPELMKSSWADLERLSPIGKLKVLAEARSVALPESGARPMQTVVELFKLRNTVAHGRSSELLYQPTIKTTQNYANELLEPLLADWERLARSGEFATRARADVEAVMMIIQTIRPESAENLFTTGTGVGSASPI